MPETQFKSKTYYFYGFVRDGNLQIYNFSLSIDNIKVRLPRAV